MLKSELRAASLALIALLFVAQSAQAYVEVPYTLGRIINESTTIVLMRVEKVDKDKHLIVYHKVRDLKGQHPGDTIKHSIGTAGFHPREWQNIMAWAEVGQSAVFFHNGSAGECCIENYWYQIYPGDWWNMSHAEPYMMRSFYGKPEKLAGYVELMLKGQEVAVPCMVDGDKNALQLRTAKVQRLKASLKIQEFDQKRDFAGWGAQDLVAIQGMPGYSQYGALARVDPGAAGIAPADFDGDGKMDFCLFGEAKVAVLQNGGSSFNEIAMPGLIEGARSASWADVDGDGKPDLLLACPSGPRLYLNEGQGKFKDITSTLPSQPYWNLTAATFIYHSDTKRPDILLADGFTGLRLWKNNGAQAPPKPPTITMSDWKICGPFENAGNSGVDNAYPPEKELKFDAKYPGRKDVKATWKAFAFPDAQVTSVKVFDRDDVHSWMAVYTHRVVESSGPGEMTISLGGGGPIKAWINGHQILNDHEQRQPAPDQVTARVPLIKGKNDLLIKYCYVEHGRSAYFKPTLPEAPMAKYFEDVSDQQGLGEAGLASNIKASHLLVADVNGDGRQDVLVGGGTGMLLLSTPTGFVEAKNTGISYSPIGVNPAFGDFNGDGKIDLVIPQKTGVKLLAGQGNGTFVDVTAKSGDAAKITGECTSVAFGDAGKGKMDLMIGCLRGCNHYLRNKGDLTFSDISDQIGLTQRIFNTRAVSLLDLNRDGVLDVVFANEGQESNLLLANPQRVEAAVAK